MYYTIAVNMFQVKTMRKPRKNRTRLIKPRKPRKIRSYRVSAARLRLDCRSARLPLAHTLACVSQCRATRRHTLACVSQCAASARARSEYMSPAAGFFSKKNGSALDFSARRGYSNDTAQQWRDGRAAKATVCKTGSGGFNSHSRLQFRPLLEAAWFPLIVPCCLFCIYRAGRRGFREKSGRDLDFRWNRGIFRTPLIIGFRRLFASGQIPIGKIFGGCVQAATLKSSCIVPFVRTLKIHPVE